ncbi:transposase, MuDR, MULE transposase domain protein [Tanacetum coccineum]
MLHDMIMKKFNLEANYPLNLSAKLPSFDDIFDITDDNEIRKFMNCLRLLLIIDATHLKGQYKGTNLVAVGMDRNNQIVPIAFGICKGETGPCWSWWMSVLKECICDSPNLLFISDRHAAIALAVHNEFPLAFHVLPVLKLAETYRAMVQEWYYKRRELADNMTSEITEWVANKINKKRMKSATWHVYGVNHYQYQVSNGRHNREVDFQKRTCQCRKWQLFGIPCGHVIAVIRFTSPPGRKFVDGLVATVDPVELDNFLTNQVKLILTNSLGYDFNSPTFLYLRNPNCSLDSGLIPLANAIQDRDMLLTIWVAFEGNTRDLDSFGEETNKITDLHQIHKEVLFTERGDGVASIKRRRRDLSSDDVRILMTASESTFVGETLRKSDQLHQTFEKSSIAMTRKLDDMIELPKSQPKRTYNEDLECEIVMVKMPKCMAWLDDEPIGDLDMMEDKVDNPSPQSTPQVLPSFEVYTPPVTHPKEVEETIGISMEVEPLDHMKLEDLGLNTSTHDLFLSSNS